jgi:hypothetical protein
MVNIQKFLIQKTTKDDHKFIPSILKFFFDEDLLSETFLSEWPEGKFKKDFRKHNLYSRNNNKIFINNSEAFIQWVSS